MNSKDFQLIEEGDLCPNCGSELLKIDIPLEEIPEDIIMQSFGWCEFEIY